MSPTTCGLPPAPPGGTVSAPSLTAGSSATYVCTPGFVLRGATTRTCQSDGKWSGEAPTCEATSVDCGPPPPAPPNGVLSAPITLYGATASYYCSSGYALRGEATLVCQDDGTWSGTAPTCDCNVTCAGVCVDLETDSNHCGGCGIACPAVAAPSTTQCRLGRCLVTLASEPGVSVSTMAIDAANLYWLADDAIAGGDTIKRTSLDGGSSTTLVSGVDAFRPFAVGPSGLYWIRWDIRADSSNSIEYLEHTSLDGASSTDLLGPSDAGLWGLAVDAANVYFTMGKAVVKLPLAGGSPTTLATTETPLCRMVVDATHVYWSNYRTTDFSSGAAIDGSVMKVPLGGGTATVIAGGQDPTGGLAVDAQSVYWTTRTAVMRAGLDGSGATTLASGTPSSVAVDASSIYWTVGADRYSGGAVMKMPREGGASVKIAVGQDSPWSIAVNSTSVYWTTSGAVMKLTPK